MIDPRASSNILVLRLSSFGDIIHTLPAVSALRASLSSEARIGWVVERAFHDIVSLVAPVEAIFVADTKAWRRSAARAAQGVSRLRREVREFARGGTSIDFQSLVKSAVLGRVAGTRIRFGFEAAAARERLSLLFTNRRVPVDRTRHVVDWNLDLARAAGATAIPPLLDFSRFADDPSGHLQNLVTASTVVINPGAGHPSKMWPVSSFVELVRGIRKSGRFEPLIIWGPGERSRAEQIGSEGGALVAPSTTFRELAFILGRARLMVSGDTGPLHLAAAMSTPVIGLYGPTSPRRNGPYGQLERCVESWSTTREMNSLKAADVLGALERVTA